MVKAVSAGAVIVAAALPVAMAGTAGAATALTLSCSGPQVVPSPLVCGSMPYGAAGTQFSVDLYGSGFAFDNGSVTATTTAPGVSISVTESSTTHAVATVTTSSTTTPGYYPITLTDDNGSATLSNAFGVDPTFTLTGASPSSIAQGSTRLITVSGTGISSLNGTTVVVSGTGVTGNNVTYSATGTSLTFDATAATTAAIGTYTVTIGSLVFSLGVTGPIITAVSPNVGLQIPASGTSSQNVVVTGSDFQPGAVVSVNGSSTYPYSPLTGVTFGTPVIASTSITIPVTILASATNTPSRWTIAVVNPDGSTATATNALGFVEAGAAIYNGTPSITLASTAVSVGANSITVTPSAAYPLSTGSTVSFTSPGGNTLTGAVVAVNSAGVATVSLYVPKYLTTTLSAAVAAGVTSLPVTKVGDIASGTVLTFADTLESTTASGSSSTTSSVTVPATTSAHAAGTVVEYPTSAITGWTLSVNNGTGAQVALGMTVGAAAASSLQYLNNAGTKSSAVALAGTYTLSVGTYTFLINTNGANLGVGTKVSFINNAGNNASSLTGTVVATGADHATVTVTVPNAGAGTLAALSTLEGAVSAGQPYININTNGNTVVAGQKLTIVADAGTLNSETVTVASTWNKATWYPASQTATYASGGVSGTNTMVINTPSYAIVPGMGISGTGIAGTVTGFNATTNTVTLSANLSAAASGTYTFTGLGSTSAPIPLAANTLYSHLTGAAIDTLSTSLPTSGTASQYNMVFTNAAGMVDVIPFAQLTASSVTLSGVSATNGGPLGDTVGSGASLHTIYIQGTFGASPASDYVVTSTTAGVTFGVPTAVSGTQLTVTMSVAAGTAVNTNVQISVIDLNGSGTDSLPNSNVASSSLLIGTPPTVTAVSAIPTLTAGESATFSVTGTGFDSGTTPSTVGFLADAGNNTGALDTGTSMGNGSNGLTQTCAYVSSTLLTCTVSVGNGTSNGQHDLTVSNAQGGVAVFHNALNISMPTVGAITPTIYQNVGAPATYVLSGLTGFNVAQNNTSLYAEYYVYDAAGGYVTSNGGYLVTYVGPNTVSVTFPTDSSIGLAPSGSLVITLYQNTGTAAGALYADAPMITLGKALSATNTGVSLASGTSASFVTMATTSTTFMPGATVTSPTAGITTTGVTVLPGIISGTVAVASTVSQGTYQLQITNPDGGVAFSSVTVTAGPSVSAVNGTSVITGPVSFLGGSKQTLTISGSNFEIGAVVSTTTAGVATFGAATVNAAGTLLTVPVTFTSFSGATPISIPLVVTNPSTGGSTSVANELVVNPGPVVTGTYYVPTFTSNTQVVINGTGFESGITAVSSNKDYTVVAVGSTPTSVTLLVSTDSNATSGTSSNVVLTNPDGGTVTFALNGGPVPSAAKLSITGVSSYGVAGTTRAFNINGTGFVSGVSINSGKAGISFKVMGVSANSVRVQVTVARGVKAGWSRLILTNGNGTMTTKPYQHK